MMLPAQPKQYDQNFEQQRSGIIERMLTQQAATITTVTSPSYDFGYITDTPVMSWDMGQII